MTVQESTGAAATGGAARLDALRRLLGEVHRALGLSFAFSLWDGSLVPEGADAAGLRLTLADEGAVASLLRRPKLDTLIGLHLDGRVDVAGGSLFDLSERRPRGKLFRALRAVPPAAVLGVARAFWSAPRGAPATLRGVAERGAGPGSRDGTASTNKANVAHHYDVSNDFYRLFLDGRMVYTCAHFAQDHANLDRAQADKLDTICRKLRLAPGERLLDIGCGWGALAIHAARHFGAEAHGVTLSEEQAALARERVAAEGLSDRVTIHLQDYRAMEGPFDKVSSIGMFEHVGLANHAAYFGQVNRLLRPGGLYLHHAIARRAKGSDRAFNKRPAEYKALTRYIFPGGELDHLGMSIANLERHGFEVHDVENWREHYRRTTRLWWERLSANRAAAEAAVGAPTTRLWLLYLAGCSLAFSRGGASVYQTLASKRRRGADGAGAPPVPLSRADLYP